MEAATKSKLDVVYASETIDQEEQNLRVEELLVAIYLPMGWGRGANRDHYLVHPSPNIRFLLVFK